MQDARAPSAYGSNPDRWLPWIIGNLFVLGLFARDIIFFDGGHVASAAYWGRDFINVWTSGKLVLGGDLGRLYDLEAYHQFQIGLFGPLDLHNFSYPPLVLPLMVPFAMLPYPAALLLWLAATGWLFVRAAEPWWREQTMLPAVLVLVTPAALMNVWAGHYGFLIGALLLFGWRNLQAGRQVAAGVCFGLMAIKPHLAVLVPLILLIRRDWTAILAAAATVTGLILISLALFGVDLWRDYLFVTLGVQASMIDAGDQFFRFMSTSLATALLKLGLPRELAMGLHAVQALTAVTLVAIAARRARLMDTALLAATATFLVLPYAFNYDLTVSAIGAAIAMQHPALGPLWRRAALTGFLAAQFGMVMSIYGLPCMPFFLSALMIVQFRLAMRDAASSNHSQPMQNSHASANTVIPTAI